MDTLASHIGKPGDGTAFLVNAAHPLRERLINELHARPFESLEPPLRASYLAVFTGESVEAAQVLRDHVVRLCARYDVAPPASDAKHFIQDLGPFRFRWEGHAEFCSYLFLRHEPFSDPFADPVINVVPRDWLDTIPGEVLIAAHVALETRDVPPRETAVLSRLFNHNNVMGCGIAGGSAMMWSDLRPDPDGFVRFLVRDVDLYDRQAGRSIQRLLEIHTYGTLALLALPMAMESMPVIARCDAALSDITRRMGTIRDLADERRLLAELTTLAGKVERLEANTTYRFSASRAYYDLVLARVSELNEQRLCGYQRLSTFLDRRLGPAMRTCEAARARQGTLADRIARASNLLRTRVEVALEAQNQDLLQSMDRRARIQLRLQATVEGLSVAAISYYVVGLIGYAATAFHKLGVTVDPGVVSGIAIPFVVFAVWWGVRRARRIATREDRLH